MMGAELPLISVIVPVYQVEPFLCRCVRSILKQTYDNLEILLIDDGSPDRSGRMCDAFAKTDARIKVIHQENAGVSQARNVGLEICKGEYVCFIDSDDWIDYQYVEILYGACSKSNADMAMCRFLRTSGDCGFYSQDAASRYTLQVFSGREMSLGHSGATENYTVVWNKLFIRKLFESLRFPVGKRYEDEFIVHQYFWSCERVAVTDAVLYFYRQRLGSFTAEQFSFTCLDAVTALEERIGFYELKQDAKLAALSNAAYSYLLRDYITKMSRIKGYECTAKQLKDKLRASYRLVLRSRELGVKKKISTVLFVSSPLLYHLTSDLYKKIIAAVHCTSPKRRMA